MVIGKCTDVFRAIFWMVGARVEGRVFVGELSTEEFAMGEQNYHEGDAGFSSIIEKK